MKINSLYTGQITTKTGFIIPTVSNNRTLESKYNPEREADNLLSTITENYNYFVIFGISSGLFISKLSTKFPNSIIFCVENTDIDIQFLQTFEEVKKLSNNSNIIFTSVEDLQNKLIQSYIPALHGNLKLIELFPWVNENKYNYSFIKQQFDEALKIISADFSVQAHFGKIWQKNILKNCNLLNNSFSFSTNKQKAVIIAAGPSLDEQIDYLKNNINSLFIISTDTAYSTLLKYEIYPEMVVSIDGQFISQKHFIQNKQNLSKTLFAFDLCANFSAANNIPEKNRIFFISGHPLSSYINNLLSNKLPFIYTGSGTVTIAALDFALFLGFNQIEVLGADFSYRNGKSYVKGTYLEENFSLEENKLTTSEKSFCKLMYRTETIKLSDSIMTTSVLNSYKTSFEEYLKSKKCPFEYKSNKYIISNHTSKKQIIFNLNYSLNLSNFYSEVEKSFNTNNYTFLLPLISYLRTKNPQSDFETLVKLAYSYFVSYNRLYEKK